MSRSTDVPPEVLADLWRGVAHVASGRVQVLEAALHAVQVGASDAPQRCAQAFDESHKLVGSLDSFGRTGGSGLALQAARLLDAHLPASASSDLDELARVVTALRRTVED